MSIIKYAAMILLAFSPCLNARNLKPGFDKPEYMEMLKIAQKQHIDVDKWAANTSVPDPERHKLLYRSPVIGLANIWDLWVSNDSVAVISVRGTIDDPVSWMPNLYAAMVSAKGTLQLEKQFTFSYTLANNPRAAIHVGWLVSTAYLSRDIIPKMDSCYKAGIRNFIITGHSQGGGICYLLTSHLESLKTQGKLPADIRFKTYTGAGPKPGNLYYAYEYENMTREGWSYNVVNTADWVPEVPFSIQTVNDFNDVNIFKNADKMIKSQKFPRNLVMRHLYNKLSKPGKKAQRNYEKYMGKMMYKTVKKQLPEFEAPEYFESNNYVRTGATIVLFADAAYYEKFPNDDRKIWQHHFIEPYLYLLAQYE